MMLSQVLSALAGRSDLFAWRPRGKVIQVTERCGVNQIGRRGPINFTPTFSDLVSDDWQYGDEKALRKAFPPYQEAEQA